MRVLATVLGIVVVVFPSSILGASPWTAIAETLEASMVLIEVDGGVCTGSVVHAPRKLVMTAAHCEGANMTVDGEPAKTVFRDKRKDILVVESDAAEGRPAILVARKNARLGEDVASFGYGLNLGKALFRMAHVSQVGVEKVADGFPSPVMAIDAGYVGGQSGGPVVNAAGEVVSMVQFGTVSVGMGIEAETIRARIGKFLER